MEARITLLVTIVIGCFSDSHAAPLAKPKTILITPDSVRYYASFLSSSARVNNLNIQFVTGRSNEELLRVPLAAPGELPPQTMVRITVGMNPPRADNDPRVGISDGRIYVRNQYQLVEDGTSTTTTVNPCYIVGGTHDGRSATHGNIVAGTYVMVFDPMHNFGSCSTNTGFATAGKFNSHVDPSQGLNLVVHRQSSSEQYYFQYFLVEIL